MQQFLFPQAATYPIFFNENLADPNRVLKIISGKNCWARSFYFQLLKLIFEIETDDEKVKQYVEFMLSISKQAMKRTKDLLQAEKMSQYFNIIQKFLRNFASEGEVQFENYINQNPSLDQALIAVFSKIIKDANLENQSAGQKLKYLGQFFEFTMLEFDKGIKFEESDTFIYVENDQAMYIAFLNVSQFNEEEQRMTQQNENENDMDKVINSVSLQKSQKSKDSSTQIVKKQSPVDYLLTNKFRNNIQNNPTQTLQTKENAQNNNDVQGEKVSPLQLQSVSKQENNLQFTLGSKKQEIQKQNPKIVNFIYLKHTETIEEPIGSDFEYKNKQSIVQERIGQGKQTQKTPGSLDNKISQDNKQPIFYKPASKVDISNLIGKGNPNSFESKVSKRDPLDFGNDSQKGTFYRKFTQTKILNLLTEPYRSKVKMLKNRFIGVHGRNHAINSIKTHHF